VCVLEMIIRGGMLLKNNPSKNQEQSSKRSAIRDRAVWEKRHFDYRGNLVAILIKTCMKSEHHMHASVDLSPPRPPMP